MATPRGDSNTIQILETLSYIGELRFVSSSGEKTDSYANGNILKVITRQIKCKIAFFDLNTFYIHVQHIS